MKRKRLFVGKKESLQKSIDRLDRIAKFYQSLILAILSGIIWSIYALLENKADKKIIILSLTGVIILIFLVLLLINTDNKQKNLIKQLEKEN